MTHPNRSRWLACLSMGLAALLASCGGDDFQSSQPVTQDAPVAGVSPFIAFVTIHGVNLDQAVEVAFQIAPAPNSSSRPVSATIC